MTDEDRAALARIRFDDDGVVRTDRFAVQVSPVKLPMSDIPVTIPVRICAVPSKNEGQ
jgi:hypothetical protein